MKLSYKHTYDLKILIFIGLFITVSISVFVNKPPESSSFGDPLFYGVAILFAVKFFNSILKVIYNRTVFKVTDDKLLILEISIWKTSKFELSVRDISAINILKENSPTGGYWNFGGLRFYDKIQHN